MEIVFKLKNLWHELGIVNSKTATIDELKGFQDKYGITLPEDMAQYFLEINGTNDRYDDGFFRFYSLDEMLPVKEATTASAGIPRHKSIIKTMDIHQSCFVLGDHSYSVFLFAVRLNKIAGDNEVYVIQGGNYKIVANSFSNFLELYLKDDAAIYI